MYPIGLAQSINYFATLPLASLIFPISYNRAIALVDTYSEFHDKMKQFKTKNKKWYDMPEKLGEGYLIRCNYLIDEFVIRLNKKIFDGSIDGVCFRSGRKTDLSQLS